MRRLSVTLISVFACTLVLLCVGCKSKEHNIQDLPELLKNNTFIYDELESDEGTALYTLRFTDNGYYLNKDNGTGVISYGTAEASTDKTLNFSDDGCIGKARYAGSSFEEPYVMLELNNKEMKFTQSTETTEYVYQSYLGTFEGKIKDKPAILVLERWNEWYLYSNASLTYGTYEIFSDGTIRLSLSDENVYEGKLNYKDEHNFNITDISFTLSINTEECSFKYCIPDEKYDAAHAMGTYTLSIYPENVFEIHGIDGYLKALGTLKNNEVEYFPRKISDCTEKDYKFSIGKNEDTYFFPQTTPLLPRSGNIDKETGYATYWNAGTKLEFIKRTQKELTASARELFPEQKFSGKNKFPQNSRDLKTVMPSIGKAKPLVLLIDFPDQHRPRHVTAEGIQKLLFSLNEPDSLAAFYYRSSYGRLTIEGKVYGWYRMKAERSSYESDTEIMNEVINYYINEKGINLSDYDADNNGEVDSLYVLWAGNMQGGSDMWGSAYRSTWNGSPEDWNRKITGYIFVPGITIWSSVPPLVCNTNSLIHESGHLLGLNDYYSYDTSQRENKDGTVYTGGALEGGLGGMDMMDTNIGDHNIFSKWLLGWTEPEIIEYEELASLVKPKTFKIQPSALKGDGVFIKFKSSDSMYTELLAIEAVSPIINFSEYSRLINPVVRILHIENTISEENEKGNWRGFGFKYDNSYTSTKYISIIEADGKDEVLDYVPEKQGDKLSYEEADYFSKGSKITPFTYPNTNAYDEYGNASIFTGLCISIDNIDSDGTATVTLSYEEQRDTLKLKGINPQPKKVPYQEGENKAIQAESGSIIFEYDHKLEWTSSDSAKEIALYSNNKRIENVSTALKDNKLVITLGDKPEKETSYTIVIPHSIISVKDNDHITNNFNGIYGFIIKP